LRKGSERRKEEKNQKERRAKDEEGAGEKKGRAEGRKGGEGRKGWKEGVEGRMERMGGRTKNTYQTYDDAGHAVVFLFCLPSFPSR
jgi:hypothetical protein